MVERLRLGERVLWSGARGRVGAVLTDQRLLAVTPSASSWRELRYRVGEQPPESVLLEERLALATTTQRALGFDGRSNNWIERDLTPRERVIASRVGPTTGLVVTDRRALGLSVNSGGFFEVDLRLHERFEAATALSGVATVTTSQRVLVFQGNTGHWSERRRPIE